MVIPNDPLKRQWIDVSSVNPGLVNGFRPSLIAFLGFDRWKNPTLAGTGFIIAGNKDCAIVFTAKHVLEGLKKIQVPNQKHVPSSHFFSKKHSPPNLSPSSLKALWMGDKEAGLLNVTFATYSNLLDIACCIVTSDGVDKFTPVSMPFDSRIPSIGDIVHMVSLTEMNVSESVPPNKQNKLGQTLKIQRTVNIRIGSVTGVFQKGLRRFKWPCFTTSIPAKPGMSGGLVYLPQDKSTIGACGVVCADISTDEAMEDMHQSGESVVTSTWPALGLSIPECIPYDNNTPKITIYDMIKSGRMNSISGIEHFELIQLEGEDYRVSRKKK